MTTELAPGAHAAPPRSATATLPYCPESARAARRLIRDKLPEWGLDDLTDVAELIVSELATNAVKTGCLTVMQVGIRRPTEGVVRIFVRDGSRELPVLLDAGEDEEGHRGLALVHELTGGQWGVTPDPWGKTVHADLRTPRSAR
ncbi:ATP-binding protein [Kitasatospora aureofaciens]|uniref:ATP-binding protein n=1 Tax=Kitasatospora aureofaciens TaxID=1894 RepID=UPI0027E1A75B|nr:ATP-binding protein [Kitasatospora aureofaciens]